MGETQAILKLKKRGKSLKPNAQVSHKDSTAIWNVQKRKRRGRKKAQGITVYCLKNGPEI